MKFQKGRSGNPAGRPAGSRNRASLAVDNLLYGEAEALTRKAIEVAKNGDAAALRLCLSMIAPPRKDRPVLFDIGELNSAADAMRAQANIVSAVAEGELTPSEAADISKIVEQYTRVLEAGDFESRLVRLEKGMNGKPQ